MALTVACNPAGNESVSKEKPVHNEFTSFAERFSIEKIGAFSKVTVLNPWQKANHSKFIYILGDDDSPLPDSLEQHTFIQTPVERVVLMSTTYITVIDSLQAMQSIVGLSGSQYVYSPVLNEMIKKGSVRDVGYDQGLNYEIIVELDPDVLFMYGVEAGVTQTVSKLEDLGIPVVMCADYLENSPLGRAEWIKFFALFYDKYELAAGIFNRIAQRYEAIKARSLEIKDAPSVFVGLPWKDTWYVPGGVSFAAQFIHDAGGSYVFNDLQTAEAEPHDLESVYSRIIAADTWLNAGVAEDLQAILSHDERFINLKAFEEGHVYNNNHRTNINGGNDYWESGIINPDKILYDLHRIFSGKEDSLFYYKSLR